MKIHLDGEWKAWPASRGPLPRNYYLDPAAASLWLPVAVPGNWQRMSEFGSKEHIVYYYHSFKAPSLEQDETLMLEFTHIFNKCTVYLNGADLGEYDYYFVQHALDITGHLDQDLNHLFLKVEFPLTPDLAQHDYLGAYGEWEYADSRYNAGGIGMRPSLRIASDIGFVDSIVEYQFTDRKVVSVTAKLNIRSAEAQDVILDWQLQPRNFEGEGVKGSAIFEVKKGLSHHSSELIINDPELWYPWDQGTPHLYTLTLRLFSGDVYKCERQLVIGFRRLEERKGLIYINRLRQFIRGVDYLPAKLHTADLTVEDLEKDIQMILDAGFNTIRVHQHLASPELYDICNENGLMIWQDIPYRKNSAKKYTRNVLRTAVTIFKQYHTHPAILFWGLPDSGMPAALEGHNNRILPENNALRIAHGIRRLSRNQLALSGSRFFNVLRLADSRLNNSSMDESFKLALHRSVNTRGRVEVLSNWGFPSYPAMATMSTIVDNSQGESARKWIGPDAVNRTYFDMIKAVVPATSYDKASEFYMASQNFQARLLRYYLTTWRTNKFKPFSGCFVYFFADNTPTVSDSIVDYYRRPKQGYAVIKKIMQPVMIFMDWPDSAYRNGDRVRLKIRGINDTQNFFPSAVLSWELRNAAQETVRRDSIVVDLEGDSAQLLTELTWEIDEEVAPGLYDINLNLVLPTQERISDRYQIRII